MSSPTRIPPVRTGSLLLASASAAIGIGGVLAAGVLNFANQLPVAAPILLLAFPGIAVGWMAFSRASRASTERYVALIGLGAGLILLSLPFALILFAFALPQFIAALLIVAAAIVVPIWLWRGAVQGWRWWVATGAIGLVSFLVGVISITLLPFLFGLGEPRWTIPRDTGIGVELLDYLSIVGPAVVAGGLTGAVRTRRLRTTLLVILGSVVTVSLIWWFAIHPQHTNDAFWTMSDRMTLVFALAIYISVIVGSRLFRPKLEPFPPPVAGT